MKAVFVIDVDKDELGEAVATITTKENDITFFAKGVIRPLPKKERELGDGRYTNYYLYRCGWNDCIDAILEPNSVKGETE